MEKKNKKCKGKMEIYSRVVGFYGNVAQWNPGKKEEFSERKTYVVENDADKRCPEDNTD